MFKIQDGRQWFYQWDLNAKLIVRCAAKQVHFCNGGETSLVVEVEDGLADVPNILLQTAKPIMVYAWIEDGRSGEEYTLCKETFPVRQRSKPDTYVYTETEVLTYEALDARLTALEEQGWAALEIGYGLMWDEQSRLAVNVDQVIDAIPHYEGSAEVTPTVEEQTIDTAGKLMNDDLTVKPIPYAEVSNVYGGKTVTIGG